jgi:hypothetical protein
VLMDVFIERRISPLRFCVPLSLFLTSGYPRCFAVSGFGLGAGGLGSSGSAYPAVKWPSSLK